jgi:hypothetical protein
MLNCGHPCVSVFLIISRLLLKRKNKTRRQRLYIFRLNRRSLLIIGILYQQVKNMNIMRDYKKNHMSQGEQNFTGGYSSPVFAFGLLEPYIASDTTKISTTAHFRYTDYVNDIKILSYLSDQYIHTRIPLHTLCEMLPISKARKIALAHGVSAGSKCSTAQLLAYTSDHSCSTCANYLCVFVANKNSAQLHVDSVIKSRKKKAAASKLNKQTGNTNQKGSKGNKLSQSLPKFPPDILELNLSHTISSACKKVDKANIEEAGCAVCGELKPLKNLSRLKNIKNLLHILSVPGVTRIERKNANSPVCEFSGPVLGYACHCVCDHCRSSIRSGKVTRLALANNLWLGKVSEELKSLRFVEKLLIARVRHTCSYVKVGSGMQKMKANIIAFESPIPKVYNIFPPPRDDMDDVLAILFTGPCKPTSEDLKRTPFLVCRNRVAKALEWLKLNHSDYADIDISAKNLDQYDENSSPVSIEYRESNTNKVAEGTSVFDKEIEDGTEEGECSFSVHGLTGEALDTISTNAIKAMALSH